MILYHTYIIIIDTRFGYCFENTLFREIKSYQRKRLLGSKYVKFYISFETYRNCCIIQCICKVSISVLYEIIQFILISLLTIFFRFVDFPIVYLRLTISEI